jgi:hypothetical protein
MVIDRRELHRLNAVGTRVFELCDGTSSVEAIANRLETNSTSKQASRSPTSCAS